MINRSLLRIKSVQILYAFLSHENASLAAAEKELSHSVNKTYELFYRLLFLPIDIKKYAQERIELGKKKFCPTEEEKNPNFKFVNNLFVKQLEENAWFKEFAKNGEFSWASTPEILKSIFKEISASDFYKNYMSNSENDYFEDKNLWREIYAQIVSKNEFLYDFIEETSLYWCDDLEMVLSFLIKNIKRFDFAAGENQEILCLEDEEDFNFAKTIFLNAVDKRAEYLEIIRACSDNWDVERISAMDTAIMLCAISEFFAFPTIPVNVTINESIEIAKSYSSEKSASFINGILDKAANKLQEEKKFLKVVYYKS